MKKLIYFFGLVIILGSASFVFAKGVKSEKRIGNIGAYERTFTMSLEECLKNIKADFPAGYVTCDVDVIEDSDEEDTISGSELKIEDIPFKGEKALVRGGGSSNGYWINAHTYKNRNKDGSWNTGSFNLSLEDFSDLVSKLLKEKGAEVSAKFSKIEK